MIHVARPLMILLLGIALLEMSGVWHEDAPSGPERAVSAFYDVIPQWEPTPTPVAIAWPTVEITPEATAHVQERIESPEVGQWLTEDEVRGLLAVSSWEEERHDEFVAVAWCESRFHTGAIGAVGERGIAQVRPEFHGRVPTDALGQIEQAYEIWERSGWQPWSCARIVGIR